ncbi:MAG: hypothetical protein ACOH1Y_07400 [Propionicimonas sp.]
MLTRRTLRTGLAILGSLVALGPVIPVGDLGQSALAAPLSSISVGGSADDLAAYRHALLSKQTVGIEVHNATIKALYAQRVQELGYEPAVTEPREIARQIMVNKYGWGDAQFSCYNDIIMRESKWIVSADNPHSTAFGIPQALPGSKMASFGADWRTNPATQIRWGLDYVHARYGTPCQAWSFKRGHGWY